MFFIVPSPGPENASAPPRQSTSSGEPAASSTAGDMDAYYRRRVAAACDRCRLKKARCSGGPAPCHKCKRDRVICILSKDQKLDTQPKPPAYVRMVESQRDLLLKAVHELRQKSTACQQTGTKWDAVADINRVLQELGVHVNHSGVVRESIMEELASPPPSSIANSSSDVHQLQSGHELKNTSGRAISSLETSVPRSSATISIPNQETQHHQSAQAMPDFDAIFDSDPPFDTASQFDETMLLTDWPPPSNLPYFNFQDPTDLNYLNMDTDTIHQLQSWQHGDVL